MKIACLGWGSLIWEPKNFEVKDCEWFHDGPYLPIEFTRISDDGRVTLIIDKEAQPVQVLWGVMSIDNLEKAIELLSVREGCSANKIHKVQLGVVDTGEVSMTIYEWAKSKNIDAVIWTGLSYSIKTNNKRPTFEMLISHLGSLNASDLTRAKEYILKAPEQVQTEYRKMLESRLHKIPNLS